MKIVSNHRNICNKNEAPVKLNLGLLESIGK